MARTFRSDCIAFLNYVSNADDTYEGQVARLILDKHNIRVPRIETRGKMKYYDKKVDSKYK